MLFQPTLNTLDSPASLAQVTVLPAGVISALAGAAISMGKKAADIATNSTMNGRKIFIVFLLITMLIV